MAWMNFLRILGVGALGGAVNAVSEYVTNDTLIQIAIATLTVLAAAATRARKKPGDEE